MTPDLTAQCVRNLEESGLSGEFTYARFGFFLSHFGRRGITCSLFHFGLWVDMPEVFASSWYSYGHGGGDLERLDFREPLMCIHEIPVALAETLLFKEIAYENLRKGGSWDEVAELYLGHGPAQHS